MGRGERLDRLDEARECIDQAVRLIREATRGTDEERRTDAYIIPTLKMCAGNDHEYLGSQTTDWGRWRAKLRVSRGFAQALPC